MTKFESSRNGEKKRVLFLLLLMMIVSSLGILVVKSLIPNGWWFNHWLVEENINATVLIKSPIGNFTDILFNNPIYRGLNYTSFMLSHLNVGNITDFWSAPFWSKIPDKPSTYPPTLGNINLQSITNATDIQSINGNFTSLYSSTGRSSAYVIVANDSSIYWKMQGDVLCDGIIDDIEIQNALNLGYTNIQLSDGTFYISSKTPFYAGGNSSRILLINKDYTWIHGSGNTTLKILDGVTVGSGAPAYEHILTMLAIDADHVKISDIIFDGNFDNVISSYCSAIWTGDNNYSGYNPSYIEVCGCTFTGTKYGSFYGDDSSSSYWNVHDNFFTSASSDTEPYGIAFHNNGYGSDVHDNYVVAGNVVNIGVGIFIDGPQYIMVHHNHVYYFNQGISLNAGGGGSNSYITVDSNIIKGANHSGGIGIYVTSGTSATSQFNNYITQNTLSGRDYQLAVGIKVNDLYCIRTSIDGNSFDAVTTNIIDSGISTIIGDNPPYEKKEIEIRPDGWAHSENGTASVYTEIMRISPRTGTTAKSRVICSTTLIGLNSGGAVDYFTIDYTKRIEFNFWVCRQTSEAQTVAYIQIKQATTYSELVGKGFGITINNLAVTGTSYGSALGTVSLGSLSDGILWNVKIVIKPAISVDFYVNKAYIGSTTGTAVPTATTGATSIVISIMNGASGGTNAILNAGGFQFIMEK